MFQCRIVLETRWRYFQASSWLCFQVSQILFRKQQPFGKWFYVTDKSFDFSAVINGAFILLPQQLHFLFDLAFHVPEAKCGTDLTYNVNDFLSDWILFNEKKDGCNSGNIYFNLIMNNFNESSIGFSPLPVPASSKDIGEEILPPCNWEDLWVVQISHCYFGTSNQLKVSLYATVVFLLTLVSTPQPLLKRIP